MVSHIVELNYSVMDVIVTLCNLINLYKLCKHACTVLTISNITTQTAQRYKSGEEHLTSCSPKKVLNTYFQLAWKF